MDPFIGQIIMFGGNFPPRGWAFCDGQLLPISSHSALFSILGTTYGGDGRSTFALPDLRGRVPIHPGSGPGLQSRRLGEKSGQEQVTLTVNEMPSHTHQGGMEVGTGKSGATANGGYIADSNDINKAGGGGNFAGLQIANAGGNQAHNNMQPYNCVNFIIALEGVYPSRS